MKNYTFRLKSGQDILDDFVQEKGIKAGRVLAEIATVIFEDSVHKRESADNPPDDELVIHYM